MTHIDFLVYHVVLEHVTVCTVVSFICNTKIKLLSRNQLYALVFLLYTGLHTYRAERLTMEPCQRGDWSSTRHMTIRFDEVEDIAATRIHLGANV